MTAVVIQMPRRRRRKRRFEVVLDGYDGRYVYLPPVVVWSVQAVNEDDAMAQARKIAMPRVDECFARPA